MHQLLEMDLKSLTLVPKSRKVEDENAVKTCNEGSVAVTIKTNALQLKQKTFIGSLETVGGVSNSNEQFSPQFKKSKEMAHLAPETSYQRKRNLLLAKTRREKVERSSEATLQLHDFKK